MVLKSWADAETQHVLARSFKSENYAQNPHLLFAAPAQIKGSQTRTRLTSTLAGDTTKLKAEGH